MDQAQRLRDIVARVDAEQDSASGGLFFRKRAVLPRIITCAVCERQLEFPYIVANLAVGLAKYAPPLPIIDGSSNTALARLFGGVPEGSLLDISGKNADPVTVLKDGPAGTHLLRIDNGFLRKLERPAYTEIARLEHPLARLKQYFSLSMLFVDMGLTMQAVNFLLASQEVVLFTSATEESMKNCFMLIKLLHRKNAACRIGLVTNRVKNSNEGHKVQMHIAAAVRKFLKRDIVGFGSIMLDETPEEIINATRLGVIDAPTSQLGKCVDLVSDTIYNNTK